MAENLEPEETTPQSPEEGQHLLELKRYRIEKWTLFFLFVYVSVAAYQGCETKRAVDIAHETFVAANKPSVGVSGFTVRHAWKDNAGQIRSSPVPTKDTKILNIRMEMKNFGPVAADKFMSTWRIFIGNKEEPAGNSEEDRPSTIFPGEVLYRSGNVGIVDYPAVMLGEKVLEMEITVNYEGANQRYTYCEKYRYDPKNIMLALGAACRQ